MVTNAIIIKGFSIQEVTSGVGGGS